MIPFGVATNEQGGARDGGPQPGERNVGAILEALLKQGPSDRGRSAPANPPIEVEGKPKATLSRAPSEPEGPPAEGAEESKGEPTVGPPPLAHWARGSWVLPRNPEKRGSYLEALQKGLILRHYPVKEKPTHFIVGGSDGTPFRYDESFRNIMWRMIDLSGLTARRATQEATDKARRQARTRMGTFLFRTTYWFAHLDKKTKNLVVYYALYKRRTTFKQLLENVDGVMSSLYVTIAGVGWGMKPLPYRDYDKIVLNFLTAFAWNSWGTTKMLKKYFGWSRQAMFDGPEGKHALFPGASPGVERRFPTFFRVLRELWRVPPNKEARVRSFLTIFNTRAFSVAPKEACIEALQKFRDTVTSEPQRTAHPGRLMSALETLCARIGTIRRRDVTSHISVSCKASYEAPRSQGGKATAYKELLTEWEANPVVFDLDDLSERPPPVSDTHIITMGEKLFYASLRRAKAHQGKIPKRVSVVSEPAKARVVTAGPAWRDVVLSVVHRVLLAVMEHHPDMDIALRPSRPQWSVFERITQPLPKEAVFACSDFSEATDHASPFVARKSLETIFGFIGLPKALGRMALKLWLAPRRMEVPAKLAKDAGIEEVFIARNGVDMGDPLTKAFLTLANHACAVAVEQQCGPGVVLKHDGVGDDTQTILSNRDAAQTLFWVQENLLCFTLSQKDTFVGRIGFFCEFGLRLPTTKRELYRVFRDSKNPFHTDPAFIDAVRPRLLNPTSSMSKHSDTAAGKRSALASEMAYAITMPQRRSFLEQVLVGMSLQSALFVKHEMWHFLPKTLGGLGCLPSISMRYPPFWERVFSTMGNIARAMSGAFQGEIRKPPVLYLRERRADLDDLRYANILECLQEYRRVVLSQLHLGVDDPEGTVMRTGMVDLKAFEPFLVLTKDYLRDFGYPPTVGADTGLIPGHMLELQCIRQARYMDLVYGTGGLVENPVNPALKTFRQEVIDLEWDETPTREGMLNYIASCRPHQKWKWAHRLEDIYMSEAMDVARHFSTTIKEPLGVPNGRLTRRELTQRSVTRALHTAPRIKALDRAEAMLKEDDIVILTMFRRILKSVRRGGHYHGRRLTVGIVSNDYKLTRALDELRSLEAGSDIVILTWTTNQFLTMGEDDRERRVSLRDRARERTASFGVDWTHTVTFVDWGSVRAVEAAQDGEFLQRRMEANRFLGYFAHLFQGQREALSAFLEANEVRQVGLPDFDDPHWEDDEDLFDEQVLEDMSDAHALGFSSLMSLPQGGGAPDA